MITRAARYLGSGSRRGLVGGAAVSLLAAGGAIAATQVVSAAPAPRFFRQPVVRTILVPNHGTSNSVTARCPAGDYLTGGGYSLLSDFSNSYVEYSGPATNAVRGGAWMVRMHGGVSGSFYVYALCLQQNGRVPAPRFFRRPVVRTILVPNHGTSNSVTARCPAGDYLTGGGYSLLSDFSNSYVEYSGPATNAVRGGAWMVRMHGGVSGSFYVYALCLQQNGRFR